MRRFHDSLVRGFWRIVAFDGFGADSFFRDKFYGGAEEVVEESPFLGIEVVEGRYDGGVIQAVVSEPLPDVCPVFLFDMGVVVFVVGPASCELDGSFSFGKVSEEVIVEELASVVAIEAEDWEREGFFDVFDLFQDSALSFSPDCALFSPPGSDIDEIYGVDVHSGGGIAAMSDRIGLEKTWPGFVPLVGFYGDVLS